MVEYHPISTRDLSWFHQFGKKVLPGIFLGYELTAGRNWKGDILVADLEDLEKFDASEIYPRRINAKDVLITHKGDEFIFPAADGTAKLSGGDYEFREPTLRREQTARSEDFSWELQGERGESQPTESTDDAEAPARLLVWTSSSTLCAEGRNIPYSTEIHWCDEVYSHWSGRHARETCRFEQKLVRFVERLHEVHSIERKTSEGIHMLRWETDKSSNDYQTRSCMARSMDENWWSRSESRRTRM